MRFNPNLYNCGKVCLSLLGTWSGGKGEGWDMNSSSALQVRHFRFMFCSHPSVSCSKLLGASEVLCSLPTSCTG